MGDGPAAGTGRIINANRLNMALYHKSLVNRFHSFTREQQIMMVCNELNRAMKRAGHRNEEQMHLTLALELMDFVIADYEQWSGKYREVCRAREMIARNWAGVDSNIEAIVRSLLYLSPDTARLGRTGFLIDD